MSTLKIMINMLYADDEICPSCGVYSADGSVCKVCQIDYNLIPEKFVDMTELAESDFKVLGLDLSEDK